MIFCDMLCLVWWKNATGTAAGRNAGLRRLRLGLDKMGLADLGKLEDRKERTTVAERVFILEAGGGSGGWPGLYIAPLKRNILGVVDGDRR